MGPEFRLERCSRIWRVGRELRTSSNGSLIGLLVAGMPQARFLKELGSRRIPIHYGAEELASDLAAIAELSPR